MRFQFTHPVYLLALLPGLAWVLWFGLKSFAQMSPWRHWTVLGLRVLILLAMVLAIAGLQWLRRVEGMNVFFLLDRSDSVPSAQQEAARELINRMPSQKKSVDAAGMIVFGAEASIDRLPNEAMKVDKVQAVVNTERTDIASAIRLGAAAFPETGQKRLVLMSDGNENLGDAMSAALSARPLGVSIDVVPLGASRGNDVAVEKLAVPPKLKKGQPFEIKIFIHSDQPTPATVSLYRNEKLLGSQNVRLSAGKNLFSFPQSLPDPGFYSYEARVDAPNDPVPQNNRASSFANVKGDPRLLIISGEPDQDRDLAAALQSARIETHLTGLKGLPNSLAEMDSYDSIFLCNVAAGDLGRDTMQLLESAVRDFGVGLVCVGGENAYAAGGYRGTPLEETLPVSMQLDSKKVLPNGALVMVMHGMEFANGNQVARDCALGALAALSPQDELGVVLWDGTEQWLLPLQKVGDKREAGRVIAGMNQGDMPSFDGPMQKAYDALKKATANLKHIIVFSDGDPAPPSPQLMNQIVNDRITVSSVLIAGHSPPDTMIAMASEGGGRFYNITSPDELPQIFIKETAVILKSAIYEDPFKPQIRSSSEVIRGIGADYPTLFGYVATSEKARAETPLLTDKGDPLLAHWQFGLGRAVAFTSDARAKWGRAWLGWDRYRQFWSQVAQWSLRRLENADFNAEVTIEQGRGAISIEALDRQGNYRNFVNLQAAVVSPKGERQAVRVEQTGPGQYEAKFPTKETGLYLVNLMEMTNGAVLGTQTVGASVNYSPEFTETEPNLNLLHRIAAASGGRLLDPNNPVDNPFLHDRIKTSQPRNLWQWLMEFAVVAFTVDVGLRRIQVDREQWAKLAGLLRRWFFFWKGIERKPEAEESLAALLARRDQVRAQQTGPGAIEPREELFQPAQADAPIQGAQEESRPASAKVTGGRPASAKDAAGRQDSGQEKPEAPASTTSRLLEAKRRAQRRR